MWGEENAANVTEKQSQTGKKKKSGILESKRFEFNYKEITAHIWFEAHTIQNLKGYATKVSRSWKLRRARKTHGQEAAKGTVPWNVTASWTASCNRQDISGKADEMGINSGV